jgi:transcriptional regulator with XRE-family HTH domain
MGVKDFTEALIAALDRSGLNQSEVARRTDGLVSQGTISTWRTGNAKPQPDGVFAVERALGLPGGSLSKHLGYLPVDADTQAVDVISAIEADPVLDDMQRDMLIGLYERARKRSAASENSADTSDSSAANASSR